MKNGKIIQIALNTIASRRKQAEIIGDEKRAEALADAEYNELCTMRTTIMFSLTEKGLNTSPEYELIDKKCNARLKKLGLSVKDFEPKYLCKFCNDTGYSNNRYCKCVRTEYYKELCETIGISPAPTFTFKDCNLDLIKNEQQRELLKAMFVAFKKYADNFPNVKTRNALIMGGTGVGKTFLMSAIYNEIKARGFETLFVTAIELNKLMLSYHAAPIATRNIYLADILACDFLIIDDLGTEQKLQNVTDEYLLQILNTRDNAGKAYFISSNMNFDQLKLSYKERLISRMANINTTLIREIVGNDLRLS